MACFNYRYILPYIMCLCGLVFTQVTLAQCPVPAQFGPQWVDGSFGIAGTEVGTQCTGRSVTVTTPSSVVNARYIFDYKNIGDTSQAKPTTSFSYIQPGYYSIVQLGTVNGKPSVWCNSIQVYGTSKPSFSLTSECGNTTKLTINTTGLAFGRYLVDWGDGKPTQIYTPGQPDLSYTYANSGAYQIKVRGEGTLALNGCNADSDPQTFEVLNDPAPITSATATVVNNLYGQISVTVPNTVKVKNYSFTKNGVETLRVNSPYVDSTLNASQSGACYQVAYADACDRKPATMPTVCTIYLQAEKETLKWSPESPFSTAVNTYTIEKLNENGQVVATYPAGNTTEWPMDISDNDVEVVYRVRATSVNGQTSLSNAISYGRTVKLFVPDTFSPNNDGLNDTFDIKGQLINKLEITVYDRWGNVLYNTKDLTKGWDGTDVNGRELSPGFYTYKIEYSDTKERVYSKLGTVNLMR
ncbi:T9SS type B sorting domain-containing protein [Runella aurantiaca]|uniref:Gliding motility-associated C-terminal domain-containing protein n=1 Tax=Runella aurantiaca TaxID=2282308 RepID=A0A369II18_9BACT|nr:gliding motility-associated C-terminal domain-containing protein [Runella aurantiaca]RDB06286.1 gliding motility-associated C-terminal domain-containing protein [Runella aurantiaca]